MLHFVRMKTTLSRSRNRGRVLSLIVLTLAIVMVPEAFFSTTQPLRPKADAEEASGCSGGYDVLDGKKGHWRAKPTRAENEAFFSNLNEQDRALLCDDMEDWEDRAIGILPNGTHVTRRQFEAAKLLALENPDAPRPPELDLEGVKFDRHITFHKDGMTERIRQYRSTSFVCMPGVSILNHPQRHCGSRHASSSSMMPLLASDADCWQRAKPSCYPKAARHALCQQASALITDERLPIISTTPANFAKVQPLDFDTATAKFYGMDPAKQRDILDQAFAIVAKHGLRDVVAVDLKHGHFALDDSLVMLEMQNHRERASTMKPA